MTVFVITLPSTAAADPKPLPVIRVLHPVLAHTLDELYAASPTARVIVDELENTDLLIHVVPLPPLRRRQFTGTTHFVVRAGGRRVMRLAVDETLRADRRAAALAHELYHALEVARARWVVDRPSFAALFHRIGHRSGDDPQRECYETQAALHAGRRVFAEFRAATTADQSQRRSSPE